MPRGEIGGMGGSSPNTKKNNNQNIKDWTGYSNTKCFKDLFLSDEICQIMKPMSGPGQRSGNFNLTLFFETIHRLAQDKHDGLKFVREVYDKDLVDLVIELFFVFACKAEIGNRSLNVMHILGVLVSHSELNAFQRYKLLSGIRVCVWENKVPGNAYYRCRQLEYLLNRNSLVLLPYEIPRNPHTVQDFHVLNRYVDEMERRLWALSESLRPSDNLKESLALVYEDVNSAIESLFGVRALLFGSCSNGFAINSSDMDLLVQLPDHMTHDFLEYKADFEEMKEPSRRSWVKRSCGLGIWAGRKLAKECLVRGWKVKRVEGAKFPIVRISYPLHKMFYYDMIPHEYKNPGSKSKEQKRQQKEKRRVERQRQDNKKSRNATKELQQPQEQPSHDDDHVPQEKQPQQPSLRSSTSAKWDYPQHTQTDVHSKCNSYKEDSIADNQRQLPLVGEKLKEYYVQIDVSFNNEVVLHNTRLFRSYAAFDERVPALGRLVKFWAKQRHICQAYRGTISGYAWLNLVLYFCQRYLVAPEYNEPTQRPIDTTSNSKLNRLLHTVTLPPLSFASLYCLPDAYTTHFLPAIQRDHVLPILPNFQNPPPSLHPETDRVRLTGKLNPCNVFFYHPTYGPNPLFHKDNSSPWPEENMTLPPIEYAKRQLDTNVTTVTKDTLCAVTRKEMLTHSKPLIGHIGVKEAQLLQTSVMIGDGSLYSMLFSFFRFYSAHFNLYTHVVDISSPPKLPAGKHDVFNLPSDPSRRHLPQPCLEEFLEELRVRQMARSVARTAELERSLLSSTQVGKLHEAGQKTSKPIRQQRLSSTQVGPDEEDGKKSNKVSAVPDDEQEIEDEGLRPNSQLWLTRRRFMCILDPFEPIALGPFNIGEEFISCELLRSVGLLGLNPMDCWPRESVDTVLRRLFVEHGKGPTKIMSMTFGYAHPLVPKFNLLDALMPENFHMKPPSQPIQNRQLGPPRRAPCPYAEPRPCVMYHTNYPQGTRDGNKVNRPGSRYSRGDGAGSFQPWSYGWPPPPGFEAKPLHSSCIMTSCFDEGSPCEYRSIAE
eukprot:GHVQ01015907.1.p1 GENE.GHVQ01015907.1~~GHVQ01015907.1.p1  ORF type:complete len:1047 (-),score=119.61 GHVQ01015907.1:987-4127(-)